MSKKNRIEINGTIDRWSFGSNYFKWQLKDCDEGPVTVCVNSYGGDVNEALAIGNQIAERGNVTVEYVAFNASAATLLGLYAQKATINSDALYLIHKTMVWVDNWGQMNEDQIDNAIEELKTQKEMASVSTLQLAKCYANKSGKPVADILKMMKDAKWLTPEEALNAGFVDEIIQSKCKKKATVSNSVAALFKSNGTPLPEDYIDNDLSDVPSNDKKLFAGITEAITNGFNSILPKKSNNPQNETPTMEKKFTHLNQVLNVEGFDIQNNAVTLTVEQLTAFNAAIETGTNATTKLTTVMDSLDTLDTTIKDAEGEEAKVTAVKNLLEKRPGSAPATQIGNDTHDVPQDYTPDIVNTFFEQ